MHEHNHGAGHDELFALMEYMKNHNVSHTKELSDLSDQLKETGNDEAYAKLMEAIKLYEAGNDALSSAIDSMKGSH